MKRLIAVLAVFAVVAGAAFAQEGSWSIGSSGHIGTRIDLLPTEKNSAPDNHAVARGNHNDDWEGFSPIRGNLTLTYAKGPLSTGFNLNQQGEFGGNLSFSGESSEGDTFAFRAEGSLASITNGNVGRGVLWGNYRFSSVLEGLFVEAAFNKESEVWKTTGLFGDTFTHHGSGVWKTGKGGDTRNYFLLNLTPMAGLTLGFKLPDLFTQAGADIVNDVFAYTVFGGTFSSGGISVAFQYALRGQAADEQRKPPEGDGNIDGDMISGAYLGTNIRINDQMTAGLELRGVFGEQSLALPTKITDEDDWKDDIRLRIGGSFNFNSGPFSAGIQVLYYDDSVVYSGKIGKDWTARDILEVVEIKPSVGYTLVDNYLRFEFSSLLGFYNELDDIDILAGGDISYKYKSKVDYSFEPRLNFNFLGTWAGFGSTGMCFRYRADGTFGENNTKNYLQISFAWQL